MTTSELLAKLIELGCSIAFLPLGDSIELRLRRPISGRTLGWDHMISKMDVEFARVDVIARALSQGLAAMEER